MREQHHCERDESGHQHVEVRVLAGHQRERLREKREHGDPGQSLACPPPQQPEGARHRERETDGRRHPRCPFMQPEGGER